MTQLLLKFIVIENMTTNEKAIYIGRCHFHKELLERINQRNINEFKCIGGGSFKFAEKVLYLNDQSNDFGVYPLEITIDLIKNNKIYDNPLLLNPINNCDVSILDYVKYPQSYIEIKNK